MFAFCISLYLPNPGRLFDCSGCLTRVVIHWVLRDDDVTADTRLNDELLLEIGEVVTLTFVVAVVVDDWFIVPNVVCAFESSSIPLSGPT